MRDVGRVLQMPYGQVDRLAKMIPMEGVKPVSVERAIATEPRLREEMKAAEVVERCLRYAQQLEGLYRNASTHAAGVVIADRPLDELVPVFRAPGTQDMQATQFNMKWVEQAGLVKFDFLGLKTLTMIDNAVKLITATRPLHVAADGTRLYEPKPGTENDILAIPLDDAKTYELYARARVAAVFQVESSGMMDALKRMKPTVIEDIVALVALYRPGPMENIPAYCEVKNGTRPLESLHPTIDHILKETQGIIVYQEQVMEIAQVMAGYSLGGADLLRRAMGKKIPEEMAKERPKFITGAVANNVPEKKAGEVFDLLEKFANYGFNNKLVEVTYECLMLGIAAAQPGARLGDIGAAIEAHASQFRYGIVREFCGHGLGRLFHDAPEVVHAGRAGTELRPGMFFTIEPMINLGKPWAKVLGDGWTAVTRDKSLSAQFEHSIAITETGNEIFTKSETGQDIPALFLGARPRIPRAPSRA